MNDESLLYAIFFVVFCRVPNVSHFIDLLNIHKITFHAEIGSDEPLPGVLGSRGAWAFIFRDIGRSSNYFQGLREPGFRFWGSREIKGTLIFRFFCSVPGLFTCRKAETDKCFSSLSIYKDNFHEGQLTSLTRAIRSLCVMQCIMGKLKHMARHSQDGGREWRQWSC